MGLMNALISEFAEREGLDPASAAAFLGDIGIRDYVLKFNEVLEKYAADPEKPLNVEFGTRVSLVLRERVLPASKKNRGLFRWAEDEKT